MVLDSRIQACKDYFGICKPEDWRAVRPAWILGLPNVGPATLDHIRMYLAARGIALRDDRTPEYWKQHLSEARIGQTMGNEQIDPEDGGGQDRAVICPFTVLIDSAEQDPFGFQGLSTDADRGNRPLIVPTEWRSLGRHPDSRGDYSIDGFQERIGVERKSQSDAHGTFLGWKNDRRERFESELENLSQIDRGYVVIESSFGELIRAAPEWGKRTAQQNQKAIFRSVLSWQNKWPKVNWLFCDDRRLAEVTTFRVLEKYWLSQIPC